MEVIPNKNLEYINFISIRYNIFDGHNGRDIVNLTKQELVATLL